MDGSNCTTNTNTNNNNLPMLKQFSGGLAIDQSQLPRKYRNWWPLKM